MANEAAPPPPENKSPAASPWADTEPDGAPAPGAQHANPRPLDKEWQEIRDKALKGNAVAIAKETEAAPSPPAEPPDPTKPDESKPVPAHEWGVLKHKRAKLARDEASFKERQAQGQRDMAALEARSKEVDRREQALEAMETDPKAFVSYFAKRLGVSEAKVINSLNTFFLEGRTPTDLELDKVKADLRRRDDEDKKRKEDEETEKKNAATAAERAKVGRYIGQIADFVTQNAARWDHLPEFSPEDVARTAWGRITSHYDQTGVSLPLDKVLDTLEAEEEKKFLARQDRRGRRLSGGQTQDPEPSGAGKAESTGQQRPQALNHGLATQRGSAARQLTDREAWEESKKRAGVS